MEMQTEKRLVDSVGEGESGTNWESSIETYALSSVQLSCSVVSNSLRPHESQHTRPPCPSPTPGVYPNSCPLSRWCHPAISSSVVPFSSCPQSLPASGSFLMSQFFPSGGKELEFQLQHQSFQWISRTDFLYDWLVGYPCSPRDSQESSPTPQFKSIHSSVLSFLYSPTLTSYVRTCHLEKHSSLLAILNALLIGSSTTTYWGEKANAW